MAKRTKVVAQGLAAIIAVLVMSGAGLLLLKRVWPRLSETALVEAAKESDLGAVQRLLASGVDVNGSPPGQRALDHAIKTGNSHIVSTLLAHGASVRPGGAFETNPLAEAVAADQPEIVKILLAHGADPNTPDPAGLQTLFNLAHYGRDARVMQVLLEGGADPNMADKRQGMTALMWSARGGGMAKVQTLVAHGANVNARARNGETVLMQAVRGGFLPIIKYLVAHGADVNAKNRGNRRPYTALMLAREGERSIRRQRDRGFRSNRAIHDQHLKRLEERIKYLRQVGAKE